MKIQIIQAIKTFDINELDALLEDGKSYMEVTKTKFLQSLAELFETLKDEGCTAFDDVFFGASQSCYWDGEGMTFITNQGFYLDLYIEEKDGNVNDIYVCYDLVNFIELYKEYDLGFCFYHDEKIGFIPDLDYVAIRDEYNQLLAEIELLMPTTNLDGLERLYPTYQKLEKLLDKFGLFIAFEYRLYSKAYDLIMEIENLFQIKAKEHVAIDAIIDFQKAKTEREKLIWYFKNRKDKLSLFNISIPEDLNKDPFITHKSDSLNIKIDVSGYEYVLEFFKQLNELYHEFMKKYEPLPEQIEQASDGAFQYNLESFLRLPNKHIDIIDKYSGPAF
ncbi:hypothetical protein [Aequorivita xiaoshiensis]|uniref:Uncharacterized protein n=1 Tax=Aequorivita xiaoshiensis TaxID=2874476 RepID=A0A9X1R024_9FLAO|nr:hypothetical protein [Aequorivita xiaoshiensis]MCG2431856.1 hypothetical protein [Aequorivita xiaoshiensis]